MFMIKLKQLIEKCHFGNIAIYCNQSHLLYVSTKNGTIGDLSALLQCPVAYFDVYDNMLTIFIDKL